MIKKDFIRMAGQKPVSFSGRQFRFGGENRHDSVGVLS